MNSTLDGILARFEANTRHYTDYVVADGNNSLIISDLEFPDTDPKMLKLVKSIGKANGIRKLIIAGDLIATDQASLNTWVDVLKEDVELTYGSVLGMTLDVIQWLMEDFDSLEIIRGNHDDRIAKKTGGEVHLGTFLDLVGLPYSQYSYMYLTTNRGPVKIIHPRQFSANSLKLAQQFYNASSFEGQKCHIVIGHTHQAQFGKSPDKLRDCVGLGCMRDPNRTKYLQTGASTLPPWDQGFLMIKNGFMHPIVIGQTDLSLYKAA